MTDSTHQFSGLTPVDRAALDLLVNFAVEAFEDAWTFTASSPLDDDTALAIDRSAREDRGLKSGSRAPSTMSFAVSSATCAGYRLKLV